MIMNPLNMDTLVNGYVNKDSKAEAFLQAHWVFQNDISGLHATFSNTMYRKQENFTLH